MSAKIIAFANQKGGVGKTTSCVNIAACVASMDKRVLLLDMDPQGNSSSGVGVNKREVLYSSYDLLLGEEGQPIRPIVTKFKNLSVIPTTIALAGAEFELVTEENREFLLKEHMKPILEDYDYIFIDCPPSLGILTIDALAAAEGIVIPMQCEYYSLEGLSQLVMTIRKIKQLYNPNLEITGILITMYNGRLNLSSQVLHEVKKYYADKLFTTAIQRNVKLSEAPSFGTPIIYHDKFSKGAQNYMDVAKELLERTKF